MMRSPVTSSASQTVTTLLADRRRSDFVLFLTLFMVMLCLVSLLVIGGVRFGFGTMVALLGIFIVAALVVCWPRPGFFLIAAGSLVVDQAPLPILGNSPSIYVFYWPPSLEGLPDRPIGFFMLFILLIFVVQRLLKREKVLQGGPLLLPYCLFLLCVVWGIVHGLATGGNLKILVNEVRSFWYLFLGYVLAYNFVCTKKHVKAFFWIIIICAGIKALEAFYIYLFVIHGDLAANHEIMAHEDSYFWISILLLIILFSLHSRYRPQFYAALALVPLLLIALIANNRRADYVALLIGVLVAWLLIFLIRPEKRKFLVVILVIGLLVGGAYVAAFYNGSGGFSSPARAIVSVFHPDQNDAASNLYRDIENYDLQYTVRQNPLGLGFGKPFLEPILLPNIISLDPVYLYIPHNTIYWVWMRLGPVGWVAMWYLFGAMIVRGCVYLRQLKDRYFQLVAIYVVSMIVMEIIVAYADYQLSFYRNVIYVAMLAGILVKLPVIDAKEAKDTHEGAGTHAELPLPYLGSRYA